MANTIEEYLKEFVTYLSVSKSRTTIRKCMTAIRDLLTKTGKTPHTLTLYDISEHVQYIKSNLGFHCKRARFTAIKKYLKYLKYKHKSTVWDEYEKQVQTTGDDMFKTFAWERPKKKYDTLEPEEIEMLLKESYKHPRDYAIITFFKHSAQRGGTIEHINEFDIDWIGYIDEETGVRFHKIKIKGSKFNQSYDIEVPSECIDALKRYKEFKEEAKEGYRTDNYSRKIYHKDALFLNGYGERLTAPAMRLMMKRYASKCGIKKDIYNHLWRATFVTLADSNGASVGQIMLRTGHTNPQSIEPYLNTKIKDSNRALRGIFTKEVKKPEEDKPKPQPPKPREIKSLPEPKTKTLEEEISKAELLEMIKELKQENRELKKVKKEVSDWNKRNLTV
jgi:integrase